jgi:predicted flap endonuclease-1-like 5' DNA nuclease
MQPVREFQEIRMLPRLLFGLGFALSGVIATTGQASAAFDPTRDELIGITVTAIGVALGVLTLIYAVKWYFGWDEQPPTDLPEPHAPHGLEPSYAAAAAHTAHASAAHTPNPAGHAPTAPAAPDASGSSRGDDLIDVEGIGPEAAATLRAAGLETTGDLLASAGLASGRKDLAAKTGLSEALLLEWVNRADLMRIAGVGSEYADLLEASGVDTVPELAGRNAANLVTTMTEVNATKHLVRRLPTVEQVEAWISEARTLSPMVTH